MCLIHPEHAEVGLRPDMHATGFQCLTCGASRPPEFRGYTCPSCEGNLDVTYDYDRIRESVGDRASFGMGRCDMLRYARLLPIEDISLASPLRVGSTPLYHAERLGRAAGLSQVYLKDEGLNPSASIKDRAGVVALIKARELGATVIAVASTGNAGSSMACLAASVGVPCVVFVPEKAPPAKIAQLLVFGAHVLAVRGTYDDAFDLCRHVSDEVGWFNRNTGFNPYTREGKKTCSYEILEQMDGEAPDRVIVPTGDGNIISGIWKGFRDLLALGYIERAPKIDCVQAEGSAAIVNAVDRLVAVGGRGSGADWPALRIDPVRAHTVADSISVNAPRDGVAAVRAVVESGGRAVSVTDEELLSAVREMARLAGVFAEPAAAAPWAGAKKLAQQGALSSEERVVCLLTGSGLKDVDAIRGVAGRVITIDADRDEALRSVERLTLNVE